MAVGRISGPLLKSNLIRNGIDLAFETDLLYLDVNNQRIGIKNASPEHELDVTGTTRTTNLIVDTNSDIADINIQGNTISSNTQYLNLGTFDNVVYQNKARIDSIDIEGNTITTNNSNANLELRPNGTGTVDVHSDLNVDGNVYVTGNITADGNVTIGDQDTDNISFSAEIASDLIPDAHITYNLGTPTKKWQDIWANTVTTESLAVGDLEVDGIDLILRQGNIYYVAENGNDTASGDHPQDPYASVEQALSAATAGDTIHVYPGVYQENFPLTIPVGVTLKGHSLRSVMIKPNSGYEYNDAFLLNGETTIEDITISGFYSGSKLYEVTQIDNATTLRINVGTAPFAHTYVSGGTISADDSTSLIANVSNAVYDHTTGEVVITTDVAHDTYVGANLLFSGLIYSCNGGTRTFPDNGYAFRFATDYEVTTRSPYIKNITVITEGTSVAAGTNSADDPRGFNAGDAGKGAYIDGAYATANSKEASMLFHSATFITPGVDAITCTNGVRVEWLNSFSYFANRSFYCFDSNDGKYGDGKTRIRLGGITGTFQAGDQVTFTSTDASTTVVVDVESVDGDILVIDGKDDSFVGFDFTPQSIVATTGSGATATSIENYDVKDFGAEVRMIGSASVYGNYGIWGDGPGVIVYAIGHNMAYIGNGKEVTNDPETVVQANEIIELNDAKIRYNTVDQQGDFRVGDLFFVDQQTGNVSFNSTNFTINSANGLTITDGADTTIIKADMIDTGNLRLSGNTLSSLSGDVNIVSASDNINLNNNVNITGNLDVTGDVTIGGNITIGDQDTDTIQFVAGIDSDIIPSTDSVYSLGLETRIWSNLYVNQFNVDGIEIRDNYIQTVESNADLELRANGTGEILVPTNNVQIDNNLTVSGNSNLQSTTVTGTLTHTGTYTQTGDTTVTGNFTVTEDLDVTGAAQFEEILVDDNYITTTTTNTDLELRAVGTGEVLIPNNDVNITNDLIVGGTITVGDINSAGTITANKFSTGDIIIDDNFITTTLSNSDLELRANGTGEVIVPSNDVNIAQDLTVDGLSTFANTTIVGTLTHTGNTTQTGNYNLTGALNVIGEVTISSTTQFEDIQISGNVVTTTQSNSDLELRAAGSGEVIIPNNDVTISNSLTVDGTLSVGNINSSGTISANNFSTGDILIDDNFITTTNSNSDLELRAAGTGNIIIDDFSINGSTIATTADMTLAPGSETVVIDGTGALRLPIGNTVQRPTGTAGQIRFNSELGRFEGYDGSNWIKLHGVQDVDGDTNITAELTSGANDDVIRFNVAGTTVVDIDSNRLNTNKLTVEEITIDGNVISTTNTNTDLELTANGTGSVIFENFAFSNNTITNTVADSITEFQNTNNGYVKFDGTYGLVLPVGGNTDRPLLAFTETGMTRFNADLSRVEIYDGTNWVSVAGTDAGISRSEAEDLAFEIVLSLG